MTTLNIDVFIEQIKNLEKAEHVDLLIDSLDPTTLKSLKRQLGIPKSALESKFYFRLCCYIISGKTEDIQKLTVDEEVISDHEQAIEHAFLFELQNRFSLSISAIPSVITQIYPGQMFMVELPQCLTGKTGIEIREIKKEDDSKALLKHLERDVVIINKIIKNLNIKTMPDHIKFLASQELWQVNNLISVLADLKGAYKNYEKSLLQLLNQCKIKGDMVSKIFKSEKYFKLRGNLHHQLREDIKNRKLILEKSVKLLFRSLPIGLSIKHQDDKPCLVWDKDNQNLVGVILEIVNLVRIYADYPEASFFQQQLKQKCVEFLYPFSSYIMHNKNNVEKCIALKKDFLFLCALLEEKDKTLFHKVINSLTIFLVEPQNVENFSATVDYLLPLFDHNKERINKFLCEIIIKSAVPNSMNDHRSTDTKLPSF